MTKKEMKQKIGELSDANSRLGGELAEAVIKIESSEQKRKMLAADCDSLIGRFVEINKDVERLEREKTRLCAEKAELFSALKRANAKLRSIVNTIHPEVIDGKAVVPNFVSKLNIEEEDV